MGRIAIWARPGSSRDYLDWDPWRRRWLVGCRAPALGGAANATILSLMARWLGTEHVARPLGHLRSIPGQGPRGRGSFRPRALPSPRARDQGLESRLAFAAGPVRPGALRPLPRWPGGSTMRSTRADLDRPPISWSEGGPGSPAANPDSSGPSRAPGVSGSTPPGWPPSGGRRRGLPPPRPTRGRPREGRRHAPPER